MKSYLRKDADLRAARQFYNISHAPTLRSHDPSCFRYYLPSYGASSEALHCANLQSFNVITQEKNCRTCYRQHSHVLKPPKNAAILKAHVKGFASVL